VGDCKEHNGTAWTAGNNQAGGNSNYFNLGEMGIDNNGSKLSFTLTVVVDWERAHLQTPGPVELIAYGTDHPNGSGWGVRCSNQDFYVVGVTAPSSLTGQTAYNVQARGKLVEKKGIKIYSYQFDPFNNYIRMWINGIFMGQTAIGASHDYLRSGDVSNNTVDYWQIGYSRATTGGSIKRTGIVQAFMHNTNDDEFGVKYHPMLMDFYKRWDDAARIPMYLPSGEAAGATVAPAPMQTLEHQFSAYGANDLNGNLQ